MCKEICIYIYIYICKEIKCYTVHGCFVYQFYYHVDLGPPILNEVKFRSASRSTWAEIDGFRDSRKDLSTM